MCYNYGMFYENAHCLVSDTGAPLEDDDVKARYMRLITGAAAKAGLKMPAYALLPGRALLYFVTPGPDLRPVMRDFHRGEIPGYLPGHCKYKLLQPELYCAHLARFIHLEPVKAGLAEKPEAYRWSSAAQYLGLAEGPADKDIVMSLFAGGADEYLAFMAETVPGKFWRPFHKNRDAVLGDRDFISAHSPHQNSSGDAGQ